MRGLILEQECNSNSSVTTDGALERSRAFMVHVDVSEHNFGNAGEEIFWPYIGPAVV